MTAPASSHSAMRQGTQACEAAWQTALAARGIVCDEEQRSRMAVALPYLERIQQRLRAWRPIEEGFDARFDQEKHGAA